jgi:hypothetical protein
LTLSVVGLLLAAMFVYAAAYVQGWVGRSAAASGQACSTPSVPPAERAAAAEVIVNVYNSTDRNGLAATTASALRRRGFKVATVSNDPLRSVVRGTAMIRYGVSGAKAARIVLPQVAGARLVRDGRTDSSIDIVLGQHFAGLASPTALASPKATPTKGSAAKAREVAATTPAPTPSADC